MNNKETLNALINVQLKSLGVWRAKQKRNWKCLDGTLRLMTFNFAKDNENKSRYWNI